MLELSPSPSSQASVDPSRSARPPSVSRVLKATESAQSKWALEKWRQQMIEKMGAAAFQVHSESMRYSGTTQLNCILKNGLQYQFKCESYLCLIILCYAI